jgi:hypothetical protein
MVELTLSMLDCLYSSLTDAARAQQVPPKPPWHRGRDVQQASRQLRCEDNPPLPSSLIQIVCGYSAVITLQYYVTHAESHCNPQ